MYSTGPVHASACRPGSVALAVAFGVLLLASAPAIACQRLSLEDRDDELVLQMPNLDLPDRAYSGNGGRIDDAFDCPPGQTAFFTRLSLPGLTYVRDIFWEGRSYPAYSLSERSPLLIFIHIVSDGGNVSGIALYNGQVNRNPGVVLAAPARLGQSVQMRVFFRGGAMESVPLTVLGPIESWSEKDPANPFLHTFRLGLTLPVLTCTLANASHALDPVVANDLAVVGASAKEADFPVAMNCPMDNVDVTLALADANDGANAGSLLVPAAGSDAGGVRVQLLRAGQPVQLGQSWRHGYSSKGQQALPFTARYVRTADALRPGAIVGEAVLTASYR